MVKYCILYKNKFTKYGNHSFHKFPYDPRFDVSKMNKLLQIYSKKITVPTGMVNGIMGVNVDDDFSSTDSEDESQYEQYEQDFVKQEMKKYAKESTEGLKMTNNYESMSEVEGVEGFEYKNNAFDIYQQYNFTTTFIKKELPIDSFKEKILHLLEINNVIIIQGPTGCGKTTQVPQYILDYCREKTQYCNIAVTQPRKIATINVARRVCEERGWALGTICGYQVGLEKQISPNVLLTYMTTGVLLQKIISAKSLNQFTHVIIDEVHERNQELDFLLLIVILMSATIDAEEFSHYFRSQSLTMSLPASIVYVNKKSTFTKTIFYMEQLTSAIRSTNAFIPDYDINMPEISEGIWKVFTFLVSIIDKLDTEDVVTNKKVIGSILVFLPGINEIEEAERRLTRHYKETREKNKDEGEKIKWEIIPLHSSLPNDEQAKVFKPTSPGYRKVILSTNIAESSVTVPGSYYVIDFCQTKVMTVDPITKFMSLKLEWASHVNCEQRAGRVGRIGNGRVYRLVPRDFYNVYQKLCVPHWKGLSFKQKMLNLNDTPQQILALALNPPNLKNIENTVLTLKEIGALLQTCRGITSNSDGDITFLGTVMASLPIDVRLSKLIILGHLFSCLEDAVVIAAGCSIQNIFSLPFQQKFNAYKKLLLWADQSCSDLIALLNLYNVWQSYRRDNPFENVQAELQWCRLNLVSLKGLREWNLLVTEIKQRLESLHIKETTGPGRIALSHIDRPLILKVIIAGSFYPNYFIRCPDEVQLDEREAVKTVGEEIPLGRSTLLEWTQLSLVRCMSGQLKKCLKMKLVLMVIFKIYVEFKTKKTEQVAISVDGFQRITNTIPGKISTEMYEVIRKRQLGHKFELKLLPSAEAWEWAEKNGIMRNTTLQILTASSVDVEEKNCFSEVVYSPIPTLDIQHLTLKITEQIDAGHFWANTLESEYYLAQIEESLNKQILYSAVKVEGRLNMGKFYAARYIEDNLFYRCKINSMAQNILQIIFIDYGNIQQASPSDIYILPDRPECRLPPLAIECVLHGIQPLSKT
ncbi:hypothetical protein NQ317_011048 [Molorchus minor]|uniref:Probable ATP-dependent RNA helicase spindle-E n=1 Tax=Molorchus minor TaxID=1323400 RepID=A0ABQ9J4V5_9CUCU|nr:hypothetical protein NQ317_011048 [Molorchus minor]